MPVYLIIVPLALLALVVFVFVDGDAYPMLKSVGTALPVILGAALYMLRAPINEWWFVRFPRRASKGTRELLERFFPYYKALNPEQKLRFENRFVNFFVQKEFQVHGPEEVPGDLRILMCATAIQITLGLDKYIYPKLGVVVLFQDPFVTPEIPLHTHAMEIKREDFDCVILSMDGFVKGLLEPQLYYHIGLHIFAKALQWERKISDDDVPYQRYGDRDAFVRSLEIMRGFRENYMPTLTGHWEPEIFPRCVEHFFVMPEKMKSFFPDVYEYLRNLLNQDPIQFEAPLTVPTEVVKEG